MTTTTINGFRYEFRDCEEEDGCIVVEQWHADIRDGEPMNDIHLPREAWTALQLWLGEHE